MLRVTQLAEIEELLLMVPHLVKAQRDKQVGYPDAVYSWLQRIEAALEANRLSEVSVLAAIRSELQSTADGRIPARIVLLQRPTKRKVRAAMASAAVELAVAVVTDAISADRTRMHDAEQLSRHLVAQAKQHGVLPVSRGGASETVFLSGVWNRLSREASLLGLMSQIDALVGVGDRYVWLARALAALEGVLDA